QRRRFTPPARRGVTRRVDELVNQARQAHLLGEKRGAALEAERRHGDVPAVVELADDVGARNAHLVVEHLAEVAAARDRLDLADFHAGQAHRTDYPGDPLVLRRIRIGAHQQLLVVGDLREAGPDLRPGDDQIVAVDHRARRQAGEVGAGTGLGKALTPDDLAAQNFRQVKRLLLLAAAGYQRRAAVVETDEQRRRVVRARAGEVLVPGALLHQRRAAAAVRLRPRYSRVARVVELALPRQI